eukprot:4530932-Pyramimonas_sp.AAC.2
MSRAGRPCRGPPSPPTRPFHESAQQEHAKQGFLPFTAHPHRALLVSANAPVSFQLVASNPTWKTRLSSTLHVVWSPCPARLSRLRGSSLTYST